MDQPLVQSQPAQMYNRVALVTLGSLQVSFGISLFLMNVADFAFNSHKDNLPSYRHHFSLWNTVFGSGLWAGGLFIIAGTFGIMSGKKLPSGKELQDRRRYLVTALVLSVIAFILSLLLTSASYTLPVIFGYRYYAWYNVFMYHIWVHFAIYLVMFFINLAQVVTTSISIRKMSASRTLTYNRVTVLTLGSLQVSSGIILVILNIADFTFNSHEENLPSYNNHCSLWNAVFGSGIWAGGLFILSGSFGIMSGQKLSSGIELKDRRRFVVAALALSVIAFVLSSLLGSASFALPMIFPFKYDGCYNFFLYNTWAHFAIYLVMFIINLAQVVVTSISIHKMSVCRTEQIKLRTP